MEINAERTRPSEPSDFLDNATKATGKNGQGRMGGIKEKDIILEINGQKITKDNTLGKMIADLNPEDKITRKIQRVTQGVPQEISLDVVLGERPQS